MATLDNAPIEILARILDMIHDERKFKETRFVGPYTPALLMVCKATSRAAAYMKVYGTLHMFIKHVPACYERLTDITCALAVDTPRAAPSGRTFLIGPDGRRTIMRDSFCEIKDISSLRMLTIDGMFATEAEACRFLTRSRIFTKYGTISGSISYHFAENIQSFTFINWSFNMDCYLAGLKHLVCRKGPNPAVYPNLVSVSYTHQNPSSIQNSMTFGAPLRKLAGPIKFHYDRGINDLEVHLTPTSQRLLNNPPENYNQRRGVYVKVTPIVWPTALESLTIRVPFDEPCTAFMNSLPFAPRLTIDMPVCRNAKLDGLLGSPRGAIKYLNITGRATVFEPLLMASDPVELVIDCRDDKVQSLMGPICIMKNLRKLSITLEGITESIVRNFPPGIEELRITVRDEIDLKPLRGLPKSVTYLEINSRFGQKTTMVRPPILHVKINGRFI